jgi:hypothetical protein
VHGGPFSVDENARLAIVLLPLLVTALPGVLLMLVLPVVLVAAPLLIPALLLVPPYLLARRLAARFEARGET